MSFTNLMPQLPQFSLPARGRNRMILLASCASLFVVGVGDGHRRGAGDDRQEARGHGEGA